ncbi:MAG: hypothetical protein P4M07_03455 [Xanthobacteraceae bacterium]|nr:hypothetical protein [Xanthobacteraceae bacterium]
MSSRSTRSNTVGTVLRTTLWTLALAGIGGAVSLGAIAVANTVTTLPSARDARLGRLVEPETDTTETLPVELAAVSTDDDAMAEAPSDPAPAPRDREAMPSAPEAPAIGPPAGPAAKVATIGKPVPPPTPKIATARPVSATVPAVLSEAQIAAFRQRLRLSPDQEPYWPEIEASLRVVARQINAASRRAHGAVVPVDTATPEVERLKSAAMPLLMQIRPDQKAEIVALARTIGMEKMVAML